MTDQRLLRALIKEIVPLSDVTLRTVIGIMPVSTTTQLYFATMTGMRRKAGMLSRQTKVVHQGDATFMVPETARQNQDQ